MQYFKFVNWRISEFVVSFFGVTNRLYVCKQEDLENSEKLDNNVMNRSLLQNFQNIVYRHEPPDAARADQYKTWWQSKTGEQNVTIQLDHMKLNFYIQLISNILLPNFGLLPGFVLICY